MRNKENKDFIYLFLERWERREEEGEKHLCVRDILIGCLSQALNWGILALQAGTQSSEPHQLGLKIF